MGRPVASLASNIKFIVDDGNAKGMHLNAVKYELLSGDIPFSFIPLDYFVNGEPDRRFNITLSP